MEWLIHQDVLREMQEYKRAGIIPTAEQIAAFEKKREEMEAQATPRNLTVVGAEAEILIEGPLTEKPRFFFFRDGTTYLDIRNALAIADSDPGVKRAVLRINSPGGTVEGLFDTIAAIEQFSKPVKVIASQAQSAAFALASAGGKIEAAGKASEFGSIGVAITFFIFDDEVTLTNTDSPEKRPNPTTEEGRASIVAHLDAINGLFVDAIASGRSRAGKQTNATAVKTNFGRGATLLAQEAKKAGMIDRITAQRPALRSVTDDAELEDHDNVSAESTAIDDTNTTADGGEDRTMDLIKLKAEHAALHASIVESAKADGVKEGVEAGVKKERDRVGAHLTYGAESGDKGMELALKAIEDGTEMTQTLVAKYMTAGRNAADVDARGGEGEDAAKATAGTATPEDDAQDLGDRVVAAMEYKGVAA